MNLRKTRKGGKKKNKIKKTAKGKLVEFTKLGSETHQQALNRTMRDAKSDGKLPKLVREIIKNEGNARVRGETQGDETKGKIRFTSNRPIFKPHSENLSLALDELSDYHELEGKKNYVTDRYLKIFKNGTRNYAKRLKSLMNKYGVKPLNQCVTIGDISRFRSAEILATDKALLEQTDIKKIDHGWIKK